MERRTPGTSTEAVEGASESASASASAGPRAFDEDREEESHEYVIPALKTEHSSRPAGGGWAHRHRGEDDESDRFFMSEPSVSEEGDSSCRVRAPHPILTREVFRRHHSGSGEEEEEGEDRRFGMMSPSGHPPRVVQQSPVPSSPGNTSLSSWDSPALQRKRFHFQFPAPERKRTQVQVEKTSSGTSVSVADNGGDMARIPPGFESGDSNQTTESCLAPPVMPGMPNSNHKLDPSLLERRSSSTSTASPGQFHRMNEFLNSLRVQSDGILQDCSRELTDDSVLDGADPAAIGSVIRCAAQSCNRTSSPQTDVDALVNNKEGVADFDDGYHHRAADESVLMSLSDSEDDDDKEREGSVDAATAHSDERPLDWEVQQNHSADDEKTAERPARVRVYATASRPAPEHRRTRSGDAAAATLATGGTDWRGMEQDNIPLPEDEDDDEEEDERGVAKNAAAGGDSGVRSYRGVRKQAGREGQPWIHRHEEMASLMQGQADWSRRNATYGTLPAVQENSRSEHWLPPSHVHHLQDHVDSRQAWMSRMAQLSPEQHQHRDLTSYSESGHQRDSLAYSFSMSTGGFRDSSTLDDYLDDYPSTVDDYQSGTSDYEYGSTDDDARIDVQENRMSLSSAGVGLPELESRFENREFRGTYQQMLRPKAALPSQNPSPFANLGKTFADKAKRAAFMPKASVMDGDNKKIPTYVCPRCHTRQRAFFSVSDAPRQLEGPSGYLALYFTIYVISSLFIFGLEEGWMPLDCIYFAVITLTTAGLGDFVPTSDANKIICSIFIYFGVACIGLLLGSYIAGMLDDRAYRSAKQKQMLSCPYCARMRTLEENAAAGKHRKAKTPFVVPNGYNPVIHSERPAGQRNAITSPRGYGYHRRRRSLISRKCSPGTFASDFDFVQSERLPPHRFEPTNSPRDGEIQQFGSIQHSERSAGQDSEQTANSSQAGQSLERTPSPSNLEKTPSALSAGSTHSHLETIDPLGRGVKFAPAASPNVLGSPMTRQILGRQSHTRHASIDISNPAVFRARNTFARSRGYSAELHNPGWQSITPTITEGSPLEPSSAPTAMPSMQKNSVEDGSEGSDSYFDDEDDNESSFSSSSSSLNELVIDERGSRLRAAKYVFLTLRQALMNSMVIIAVGCVGFWLIEGFSFVDSWYFTTVLLTTVGYGDIVPVTRGGKLFATIYILVAGTILLNNMSMISMIPLELRKRRIERAVLTQFGDQLDDDALRELATGPVIQRLHLSATRPDGLDECTREMFALAMLVRLGKVTEQDIRETFAAFRRLDVNNEGVLNSKSIIAGMIQKRRTMHSCQPPPPPPDLGVDLPGEDGEAESTADEDDAWEDARGDEPCSRMPTATTSSPTATQAAFNNLTDQEREEIQRYWFTNGRSLNADTFQHNYGFPDPEAGRVPEEQAALLPHHTQPFPQRRHGRHRGTLSYACVPVDAYGPMVDSASSSQHRGLSRESPF